MPMIRRVAAKIPPTGPEDDAGRCFACYACPRRCFSVAADDAPPPRSGRWIRHEVDFALLDGREHGDGRRPRPKSSAIFEYLQPRTIAIDTSGESGCMLDVEMWKRFVSTVNASVGGNSFVDLYCKRGDPRMKLVIF